MGGLTLVNVGNMLPVRANMTALVIGKQGEGVRGVLIAVQGTSGGKAVPRRLGPEQNVGITDVSLSPFYLLCTLQTLLWPRQVRAAP